MTAGARPVRILAAGGTIAMTGSPARPALDAADLLAAVPALAAVEPLEAETLSTVPGVQLSPAGALAIARRAADAAGSGEGVVVTTGTDTLEELALLCDLLHDDGPPVAVTGANRPASAPGADGPANLLDAVAVARAPEAVGLGAVVVFGGEVHAAARARKVDSSGPAAFGSPLTGPLGRVVEGRVWLAAVPVRGPALSPEHMDASVVVVTTGLGDDGRALRALLAADRPDGVVVEALGAGHLPPAALEGVRAAVAAELPVVVTVRPPRAALFASTYAFEGAEGDVRATDAIPAPFLSAPAARIKLMACLGAGLEGDALRAAFATDDAPL